jgi:hypothetical protein
MARHAWVRRSVQQLPQHGRIQRSERSFGRVIETCGYVTGFVVLFGRASGGVGSMLRRSG